MPVDLAAMQADDALLDLIGRAGHTPSDADDELTRVLAAWRREVHTEPFAELVDTNTALEMIRAARQPVPRGNPVFSSIAAAAAVLVIAFSAVGLVAKSAQPGDQLWPVAQVLYSDYARSVETAAAVRTELNEARTALNEGNPERARASLQRVQKQLPAIGEAEGRTDLTARHRQLEQMLSGSPDAGSVNLPGVPMFPSPGATSARREPSRSPKSSEPPRSAESNTTSNPSTEAPGNTAATRPNRIPPNRIPPSRVYPSHGYPGPDSSSSDSGPGPTGIGPGPTTGGAADGGSTDGGTTSGGGSPASASPNSGSSNSGSSNSDPARFGPPRRAHARDNPSDDGAPPECDRPGPKAPYCG